MEFGETPDFLSTRADFSDSVSTFGDRVASAREAMGLSQDQLAHRMGVKSKTMKSWEEDRSEPRANKLQMLAGMLNVSIVWLMSGQGETPELVKKEPLAAVEDCLIELRRIRVEQMQLVERMARLEKRLRAALD